MRFALWPSFDRSWEETLTVARFAADNGYASFWYADHLMPDRPDGTPDPGDALDCWTVLAGVAALVPRVRLVSMVSPLTIHHPVVLAKRATTVDHISAGRVVLGLGAGWQVNEHASYGFDLLDPGPRVSRFAEGIEVIHRLLREDSVTFDGRAFTLRDAPFSPKPLQQPLPLLVGTKSPRMFRLAARFAAEYNTWGNPDLAGKRLEGLQRGCAAEGRDPDTIARSVQAVVLLTRSQAELDALGEFATQPNVLAGSPEQLQDSLGRYVELGFDEFALPDFTLGPDPAARADKLAEIHAEVISPLM